MYSCAKGMDDKYGWHLHLPMNDGCTKGMDDTYFNGFVIPQVVRYPVSGI